MNHRLALIFTGLFFALCMLLSACVWFSLRELRFYREEYDMLNAERNNSMGTIIRLKERNKTLTQINNLSITNTGAPSDVLVFYSEVRQSAENNGMNILSMSSNQNENGGEGNIFTLKLEGNYYSLAQMLADWRKIPFASRVNSMVVKRDATAPMTFIEADIVLEAKLAEN